MVELDLGRRSIAHLIRLQFISARLVVLIILVIAAIVAGLIICGLLRLVLGPLPAWLWFAVLSLEVLPAIFLAGALFVGGEDN